MSKRRYGIWLLLGMFLIAGGVALALRPANSLTANLEKVVPNFSLKDTDGRQVALADFNGKKAVVVVFVGTECPINNVYMPRLAELQQAYAERGVQFLAVNANQQDTPERVALHARKNELPFPVLKDEGNHVADLFAAERTPEAFVLDGEHKVRYRGRIDDQFGISYKRVKATRNDLAQALDEVLAGKPVSQTRTDAPGCIIARATTPKADGSITFSKQVVRILQKNCQECHRPGQVAPMPLLTYDDAVAWSETIREVIQEQRMPPWYADPRYGHFTNDRRLPEEERNTLLAWIEQGTPRGDDKELPPPREFVEGWTIGKPDMIFSMPQEYQVCADMPKRGIPYQRFRVATNFKEERWIERAEARPGAAAVVHHIVIYIVPPKERFWSGNPKTPVLVGTAPGEMPLIFPAGYAKKIPAGSDLMFEMHYTPNGVAQKDRSSVGLVFAREEPRAEVHVMPLADTSFRFPAAEDNVKVKQSWTFQRNIHLMAFMPHMHLRGKDFLYEAIYPDGQQEILLSVPHYNFNWQSAYRVAEPIRIPKGAKVHCVAHFDNSAKNPNNPDPSKVVSWGEQTWEEMMIGWMDYVLDE